ncbi:MAG: periplasmic heavy metal sensor [bacterium]
MTKKWFLIIVVLLTVVNLAAIGTFVCRHYCHKRGPSPMDRQFHRLKKELRLTDEQVARMRNSREKFDPEIEEISNDLREKRHGLVGELKKKKPDSALVEQILRGMDSSQSVLQRKVVSHLLEDKAIFTPGQQEKFFSIILERFPDGNKPDIKR